ncbi:MAG: glutamate--tRNA ligase [Planctomycetia bacterium]|nr:glutamate--tRNA ligase [Planctomycetia bacterium]
MTVRTRFAPSPTGYLHIGGVRTALFNWLFARHHGGQFVLRIDDTDQQRNVEEALAPILHGLLWLGIDWDEGPDQPATSEHPDGKKIGGPFAPYYQSQRTAKYQAAVDRLIGIGAAYHDYAKPEEVQAERAAAEAAKLPVWRYSRKWMGDTPEKRAAFEAEGRTAVIRLKMPESGTLVMDDLIRGRVEFDWAREQDHVIQRADGSFIYHLANVVDDEDFRITHVIRAEEHLSNTPRQIFMLEALGYERPRYAHLPFVAEPGSHTKLSKRKLTKYLKQKDFANLVNHADRIAAAIGMATAPDAFNPVVTDFYERVGYLPEAIVNYLCLLGWSLDDKTDHLTMEQMIEHFSLERVNRSPASFDPGKLFAFQERHMWKLSTARKLELTLPFALRCGMIGSGTAAETATEITGADRRKIEKILAAAGDRIRTAGDIIDYSDFFATTAELPYDEKSLEKVKKKTNAVPLLAKFVPSLESITPEEFTVARTEETLRQFVESEGCKPGDLILALRFALTGKNVGFGLFETLEILGRTESLARIDRFLKFVA